jgi:hypothetical protein
MHVHRSARATALVAAALVASASAGTARAEAPASPEAPPPEPPRFPRFDRGAQELAAASGYALGLDFGAPDSNAVRLVPVLAHWGIALTHPYAAERWYAGSLSFLLEGVYLQAVEPHRGRGGGADLILRHHFVAGGRIVPFLELGGGFLGIDFDIYKRSDGFNFALLAGAGVQIFLTPCVALTLEWRLHHISNAGIHRPNDGINTMHFLGGLSFFLG